MCTKLVLFVLINFLFVYSSALNNQSEVGELINTEGQLKIALILNECTLSNRTSRTYANSALWLTNRLNSLNYTHPLRLGLSVRGVCSEDDYYDSIFKVYKESSKFIFVSLLASDNLPEKVLQFQNILGVNFGTLMKHSLFAIEASIGLLQVLDFRNNVTVYSDDRDVLQQFHELAHENLICVQNGILFGSNSTFDWSSKGQNGSVVVYADSINLDHFLKNLNSTESSDSTFIFISSDTSEEYAYPEGSYVIQPIHLESTSMVSQKSKLVLSSLLFDIANPILQATANISNFIKKNCNETLYKFNCLQNKLPKLSKKKLSPLEIVTQLRLTSVTENFVYKIFVVENLTYSLQNESTSILQSFEHIYTYKIFNKTMLNLETEEEIGTAPNKSEMVMCNLWSNPPPESILRIHIRSHYRMRSDSWIYAFLAISALGVLFSIAVLIFLIIRLCKSDILEGNPVLTIFLLLSVIMIYCAVIPFAIQGDGEVKSSIILSRALSATLVYAYTFSLLLSRSILLATVSNDIGFMSHISGPVQSFLTLFIFGVQGALSLQVINHCEDIFKGNFFIYLMSYNVMLLVLLIFITPINSRVHRNYKEGKYFTVAVALTAFAWSCWIPGYMVFDEQWKDLTICSGLVSTASILLGSIFIPRTYKMAVAAAKDRLTNAIPSLPSTSSIMDVYRASTQPIYDCINFAAVNAASISRNGIPPPPPQPQLYPSGNSQYEDDFNFENFISLRPSQDKVTRF